MTDRFKRWTAGPRGNEPVVLDSRTGLVWQGTPAPKRMTWQEAMSYAESLRWGQREDCWRLPTVQELVTIVDYGNCDPAIDQDIFPKTSPGVFWSSTSCVSGRGLWAWYVAFDSGYVSGFDKVHAVWVRCVQTWPG